jgi:hypothetical protein
MEYNGSDRIDTGQLSISKRWEGGLSIVASYTQSKATEKVGRRNGFDEKLEERTSSDDRPKRASVGASIPIPVGHGRKWGSTWSSILDAFFGGWNISLSYQYQDGFPLTATTNGIATGWPQLYFDPSCSFGDLRMKKVGSKNPQGQIYGLDVPAWDTYCFYFHDSAVQTNGVDDPKKQRADPRIALGTANARYNPTILDSMRTPVLYLLDLGLSKWFDLGAGVQLQIRIDAINAINYTAFWPEANTLNPRNANFGIFTSQRNNPRDIQLGGRITF